MRAAEALCECREQIAALKLRELELIGAARKEQDEAAIIIRRAEWEAARRIDALEIAATWPVTTAGGVKTWLVGAGTSGRLLVVYKLTRYRGATYATRIHGEAPPMSVDLDVCRAFDARLR
jgi:hypothetical protein